MSDDGKEPIGQITAMLTDDDGRIFIPADEAVDLVRGLGRALLAAAADPGELDAPTLEAVAASVEELADAMDVDFIEQATEDQG